MWSEPPVQEVGTVRRFLTPWILFVIASAVLSCAEVWPNPM
jgi:hypothetical protein